MIDNWLLHPNTRLLLEAVLGRRPHAILLYGPSGSGKTTTAQALAAGLMDIGLDKLQQHPYVLQISAEKELIGIDAIRNLQQFIKLKAIAKKNQATHRVVIIHDAHTMRLEAQNALLKTLEEPPEGTVLILTAEGTEPLLQTIRSRTVQVPLLPVSEQQARDYFSGKAKPDALTKHYILSQGAAGLLHALINNVSHPLLEQIEEAKKLLALSLAERLLLADTLAKDRQALRSLLDALQRICHAALFNASRQLANDSVCQKWHERQAAILDATKYLRTNANAKLLVDDLLLRI